MSRVACKGRRKPTNRGLRYDPGYWSRMGAPQPVLDMPMFGPGRKGGSNDYSPYHNDGALNGGVSWVPGSEGMGLEFGGTGYVSAPNSPSLNPTKAIFLAARIMPNTLAVNGNIISKGFTSVAPPFVQYSLKLSNASDGNFGFEFSNAGTNSSLYSTNSPVIAGIWQWVAAIFDGLQIRLLYDGEQVASASSAGSIASYATPLSIGYWSTQGSQFFNGCIDEPLISSAAPTPAQVARLYTNPWGMFTRRATRFGKNASGGLLLRRRRAAAA